jgi:predicted permease
MADLKLAFRSLSREPGVTFIALVFFAIGIAANTTMFSLVQAVEFPRLLYPDAARIVFLETSHLPRNLRGMLMSGPDAVDTAATSRTLTGISVTGDQSSILRDTDPARRVGGRRVTPSFFDVMQVAPAQGRVLQPGDGADALVLGDALWRSAFNSDPAVVGRSLRLDGGTVTVVGIMPPEFDEDADFWVAWPGPPAAAPRDDRQYMTFARLAPGATIEAARRELADLSARLAAEHRATNEGWVAEPVPLQRLHGRDSRGSFFMLQGAVAFVLLIACANISNLLLARGTRRRHEMAVRLSLGATRRRLLRLLLTESVLLAAGGGLIGTVLSLWGVRLARVIGGFPAEIDPTVNPIVLLFTAVVAMLTGVISGVVPALRTSRVPPQAVLRTEGGRGASRTGGVRTVLVAVQVASAIALAMGGALMLQTMSHRLAVDLGFRPERVVRADVVLTGDRYSTPEATHAHVSAMMAALNAAPDVEAAGVVTWALPTSAGGQRTFSTPGSTRTTNPGVQAVTPEYFQAMGIPSLMGRGFTAADGAGAAPVAIVNEALARQLWPGEGAAGKFLRLGPPDSAAPVVSVVGVVGTTRRSPMHDTPTPRVYVPFAQHPNANLQVIVRGRTDTNAAALALTRAVSQTDASAFPENLRTMTEDTAQFVAPIRLITVLLGGFAAIGLLLAALGVFGTMSYSVSQRARELAIRSALGATRGELARMVIRNALFVTAAGIIPGIAAALLAAPALGSFLYGVSPTDLSTLAIVVGVLLIVSLAACYRPVTTAASIDPMAVLRRE